VVYEKNTQVALALCQWWMCFRCIEKRTTRLDCAEIQWLLWAWKAFCRLVWLKVCELNENDEALEDS